MKGYAERGCSKLLSKRQCELDPIHTIPDSSYIGLLPTSDRPSIRTIPDESDMLRIAFAESNHSAVKVVCIGVLSISDHS